MGQDLTVALQESGSTLLPCDLKVLFIHGTIVSLSEVSVVVVLSLPQLLSPDTLRIFRLLAKGLPAPTLAPPFLDD